VVVAQRTQLALLHQYLGQQETDRRQVVAAQLAVPPEQLGEQLVAKAQRLVATEAHILPVAEALEHKTEAMGVMVEAESLEVQAGEEVTKEAAAAAAGVRGMVHLATLLREQAEREEQEPQVDSDPPGKHLTAQKISPPTLVGRLKS
jgi:hypothetical protein